MNITTTNTIMISSPLLKRSKTYYLLNDLSSEVPLKIEWKKDIVQSIFRPPSYEQIYSKLKKRAYSISVYTFVYYHTHLGTRMSFRG
jgi:hypothetical protein